MTQKTDLYSILSSYVTKHNNPYVDIEKFVKLLQHHAARNVQENPEWKEWINNTRVKFNTELAILAEEGKCILLYDVPDGRIYLPEYVQNQLHDYYRVIDNYVDNPFPSEETLNTSLPEKDVRSLGVGSELTAFMEEMPENTEPVIRIGFPDDYGSALVLPEYFPRRLMEACMLKIRNYLRDYGNKEYIHNKLLAQLMNKENALKDLLNRIVLRPIDCCNTMEEGGEFPYLFWAHFCLFFKNDIRKKKERSANDFTIMQAVYIIEAMNIFYKNRAAKSREKELAFRNLEQKLSKPPYLYTLEQIIKFTNAKGVLLLGLYTRAELAEQIKKLTNESAENKLPELLVLAGPRNERYFIMKNKMPLLCNRLIMEAKFKIKQELSKHWLYLLRNYKSEPAMENDREFEKALYQNTKKFYPILVNLLEDPKFQLVNDELNENMETPQSANIFVNGYLVPYSALYLIGRRDLLEDVRLLLPFWYSLPLFITIMAFFRDIFKGRKNSGSQSYYNDEEEETVDDITNAREGSRDILGAARVIENSMVPENYTLDSYLEELKTRWSRLISQQARDNLVEDVNALIRDNLRQAMRLNKPFKITNEAITQLAAYILDRTQPLQNLQGKDSLKTYIELYILKQLETVKF